MNNIDKLKIRNEILEKRCERYTKIMRNEGISVVKILEYQRKGMLTMNDARYFSGYDEIETEEEFEENFNINTTLEQLLLNIESDDVIVELWEETNWLLDAPARSKVFELYLDRSIISFEPVLICINGDYCARLRVTLYKE